MGMFDNLIVDNKILPDLTEDEMSQLKDWQTKSFENTLTNVYIVEDNKFNHSFIKGTASTSYKLQIKEFDWEEVPMDERPYPNSEGFESLMGCMREVNVRIVDHDLTGFFRFYTYLGDFLSKCIWYEFIGEAKNGKIISIKKSTE